MKLLYDADASFFRNEDEERNDRPIEPGEEVGIVFTTRDKFRWGERGLLQEPLKLMGYQFPPREELLILDWADQIKEIVESVRNNGGIPVIVYRYRDDDRTISILRNVCEKVLGLPLVFSEDWVARGGPTTDKYGPLRGKVFGVG